MECWMVCRALMLNKVFEVSKVSTSFSINSHSVWDGMSDFNAERDI